MVDRIFKTREFSARPAAPPMWLDGGASYARLEPVANRNGQMQVVKYDSATAARARGADHRRAAHAAGCGFAARGRGPVVVGRRTAGPDLHQHPPCLAHQLARRLLAARSAGGPPQEAWRQRAGSQPDVRAVQSRRDEGRLRAAERSLRRGPGERSDLAPDAGRLRSGEQRRGRLGERGRARSARLLPLEPGRHAYRLLAVRPARRRATSRSSITWARSATSSRSCRIRSRAPTRPS